MALSLRTWVSSYVMPGTSSPTAINLSDDELLRMGGNPINGLPVADGTYFANNGGAAAYTGTSTVAHYENPQRWDYGNEKTFKIDGTVSSLGGRKLEISNFVHVDVNLKGSGATFANVDIDGVKRGSITTDSGGDVIKIHNTSNTDTNPGFTDWFNVSTNSGDDCVTFDGATPAGVKNSPYLNYNDGHSTSTVTNLGSGDDTFDSTGNPNDPCGPELFQSKDTVDGGSGNDIIATGANDDSVMGGAGCDLVNAGSGNDTIDGGTGNDNLYGASGNDLIYGGEGSGADYIDGGEGNDTINGGSGADSLIGGTGNDKINADGGADWIDGHDGDDLLDGGAGSDSIEGGLGNDTLMGGGGVDVLQGDEGDDTFIIENIAGGKTTILDFAYGNDVIDVSLWGITQAILDSNTDGFITAADAKATQNGDNIDINLGSGHHLVVNNFDTLDVADFHFA